MSEQAESKAFVIRPAKSVEEARDLWWPLMQELGWNRAAEDAQTHFVVAKDGAKWFLLVPESTGKPEGCIIAFTYDNGTAWVGFFCVNAKFRRNGWGRALFKALQDAYAETPNMRYIGLDAVLEQVPTYARRGFLDVGRIKLMARDSLIKKPLQGKKIELKDDEQLVQVNKIDPGLLAWSDLQHTGFDRSALWTDKGMFHRKDAYGFGIVKKPSPSQEPEILLGFVLVRKCEHGRRFGPLIAESYDRALFLLQTAMDRIKDEEGGLIAEIFGANENGMKVFEDAGWEYAGIDYHRMWVDGKMPPEQDQGGKGQKDMYAIFDASQG